MIALAVGVLDVLMDRSSKVTFPDRNDLRQTLRPDRSYESLGVCVQIRTAARKLHGVYSRTLEDFSEALREERVAVVNEKAATKQESVFAVCPVSCDLAHPGCVGRGHDSCDLDLTGLEVDGKQTIGF